MDGLDRERRRFSCASTPGAKMSPTSSSRSTPAGIRRKCQRAVDRDTAIVTLPHEIFVELGMAIKSGSPFRTTMVISLANDLDFYIPTRRAFEEGHYEPTACPLEPGCGEDLVHAALGLLRELKSQ